MNATRHIHGIQMTRESPPTYRHPESCVVLGALLFFCCVSAIVSNSVLSLCELAVLRQMGKQALSFLLDSQMPDLFI